MDKTINWLLEDENPSVKYNTLTEIIGNKLSDEETGLFKNLIFNSYPVKSILDLQDKEGWWTDDRYGFYPLYKSTVWQLYFLSLLGVKKEIKQLDESVKIVVGKMQAEDYFFSKENKKGKLICYQGIVLETLLALGYREYSFTENLMGHIFEIVNRNDFRCRYRNQMRCPWGAVKLLKAFNLLEQKFRNKEINSIMNKAKKFLISHDIVEANYPRKKTRSNQWHKFSFPRGCHSDILELTSALVDSGCKIQNSNIKNALKYVYEKRTRNNRWKLESSLNGKMLVEFEEYNKPSKWITYFAVKTLLKSGYINI